MLVDHGQAICLRDLSITSNLSTAADLFHLGAAGPHRSFMVNHALSHQPLPDVSHWLNVSSLGVTTGGQEGASIPP